MNTRKNKPPELARKILLGFLKDYLAEEVQGDLDENFYLMAKSRSLFRARPTSAKYQTSRKWYPGVRPP